jgi:hypothetical protein
MIKKVYLFILCGLLSAFVMYSCTDDDDFDYEKSCHDEGQLYCNYEGGKSGCCDTNVPWTDGHGTCYNSQSYCTASGWSCVKCW